MLDIEKLLIEGNLRYHLKITQDLENIDTHSKLPKYPIMILTCMDPRIDVHRIFQLEPGDVFVVRNAGNLYSQDSVRSILLAIYQYNIKYIVILGHLDCGMTKINLLELKKNISYEFLPYRSNKTTDIFKETREYFKPFHDELLNIEQQIEALMTLEKNYPEIKILGMLYDVETGFIFEYNMLVEFASIKNFKNQYKNILREKQLQFTDFLETIEVENRERENLDFGKQGELQGEGEEKSIVLAINETLEVSKAIQNQTREPSSILTKIQVPKIKFPGVKIHIPRIYRKRIQIKNEN
ncbi:MAG: carbonic anhydrase [Promethearchaeota archaeon]|jgi:carbonic anhydrase